MAYLYLFFTRIFEYLSMVIIILFVICEYQSRYTVHDPIEH